MGYTGTLIAVRDRGRPLASLGERAVHVRQEPRAARGDGWRVLDVEDDVVRETDVLPALAAETDAPVLAASVVDSDYGWLVGLNSPGERWEAWLDPDTAYEYERDHQMMFGVARADAEREARRMVQAFGLAPAKAAQLAVRWAAVAGYSVRARPIRQVLATRRPAGIAAVLRLPNRRYVFAEEMFFDLLDHLGVPSAGKAS